MCVCVCVIDPGNRGATPAPLRTHVYVPIHSHTHIYMVAKVGVTWDYPASPGPVCVGWVYASEEEQV